MRRQVLLPQPEGPTRTRNSLSLISRLMSCTTSTLPKRLYTCSNSTRAMTVTPFRSPDKEPTIHQGGHTISRLPTVAVDQLANGHRAGYELLRGPIGRRRSCPLRPTVATR